MINKVLNYWIVALSVVAAGMIAAVTIVHGWGVWIDVWRLL